MAAIAAGPASAEPKPQWLDEVDARDRPELERLRELLSTEPGWKVEAAALAGAAKAELAGLPEHRVTRWTQLAFSARLVCRIESWGGLALKRGSLDGDPALDWL